MDAADAEAVAQLAALGLTVRDVQAIVSCQDEFAVRCPVITRAVADGIRFTARPIDLGGGAFTNMYELRVDLGSECAVEPLSRSDAFFLADVVGADPAAVSAVSGTFSLISDDPTYQPHERCFDLCIRGGRLVSLPLTEKPVFWHASGRPFIARAAPQGVLYVGGRAFGWAGARATEVPVAALGGLGLPALGVSSAASCRVQYRDSDVLPFLRVVDRSGNRTGLTETVVDAVVTDRGDGLVVERLYPGGNADLFAGNFILRGRPDAFADVRPGTAVRVATVGNTAVAAVVSALTLGPSVADGAVGRTGGYGEELGSSPFRGVRHARTTVGIDGGTLTARVFDGAPAAAGFTGVTPAETAALTGYLGDDPDRTFHVDGGGSSKMVIRDENGGRAVFGSMHYVAWPKDGSRTFRWQGLLGRPLVSCFAIRASPLAGR